MQVLNLVKGDMEILKWAKEEISSGLEDSKLLKDEKLQVKSTVTSKPSVP